MSLIQNTLAFLLTLGILVVFHELGHYLVARWCGVKILRFSVGMGKVVFSRKFGSDQTEWAISALPLGGYVKMLDARESGAEKISEQDLSREFCHQSVWKRIAIVAAGPLANFLLAIIIFAAIYCYGVAEPVSKVRAAPEHSVVYQAGFRYGDVITSVNGVQVQTWSELQTQVLNRAFDGQALSVGVRREDGDHHVQNFFLSLPLERISQKDLEGNFLGVLGLSLAHPHAIVAKVLPDGAGARAGLMDGDQVTAINGRRLLDGAEFAEIVSASPGKVLEIEIARNGQKVLLQATPAIEAVEGRKVGRLKVQMQLDAEMVNLSLSPLAAFAKASQKTWDASVMIIKMLGKMITGDVSLKNITGPLTIADYAGQTSRIGLLSFLSFIASVSISLGVMNLLPVPVLDGGHLLYYSLEVLTGKPVSERFSEIAQRVGVGLLLSMMMLAFFNDIVRLMS